jgi:hypothetical protein
MKSGMKRLNITVQLLVYNLQFDAAYQILKITGINLAISKTIENIERNSESE